MLLWHYAILAQKKKKKKLPSWYQSLNINLWSQDCISSLQTALQVKKSDSKRIGNLVPHNSSTGTEKVRRQASFLMDFQQHKRDKDILVLPSTSTKDKVQVSEPSSGGEESCSHFLQVILPQRSPRQLILQKLT